MHEYNLVTIDKRQICWAQNYDQPCIFIIVQVSDAYVSSSSLN